MSRTATIKFRKVRSGGYGLAFGDHGTERVLSYDDLLALQNEVEFALTHDRGTSSQDGIEMMGARRCDLPSEIANNISIEGPWLYRPREHDDWGTVRNHDGDVVCQVRFPYRTPEELSVNRELKTDPWEGAARLVAAAPAMRAAIKAMLPFMAEGETREKAVALLASIEGPTLAEGADK